MYCECGCGGLTNVAKRTVNSKGYVKGQPRRFLPGHGATGPKPIPLEFRLLDKIDFTQGECWEWTAAKHEGYGEVNLHGQMRRAYRIVYELLVGPVPEGLELDHLCRNRACVNPAHLEPVTHRVNMMRGAGVGSENAAKTHCIHGHPFDEENTIWRQYTPTSVRRECRTCMNAAQRRYQKRKAARARVEAA